MELDPFTLIIYYEDCGGLGFPWGY